MRVQLLPLPSIHFCLPSHLKANLKARQKTKSCIYLRLNNIHYPSFIKELPINELWRGEGVRRTRLRIMIRTHLKLWYGIIEWFNKYKYAHPKFFGNIYYWDSNEFYDFIFINTHFLKKSPFSHTSELNFGWMSGNKWGKSWKLRQNLPAFIYSFIFFKCFYDSGFVRMLQVWKHKALFRRCFYFTTFTTRYVIFTPWELFNN